MRDYKYPKVVRTPEQGFLLINNLLIPSADTLAMRRRGNSLPFKESPLDRVGLKGESQVGNTKHEAGFSAEKFKLPELQIVFSVFIRAVTERDEDTESEKAVQNDLVIGTEDGIPSNRSKRIIVEHGVIVSETSLSPEALFVNLGKTREEDELLKELEPSPIRTFEAGAVSRIVNVLVELGLFNK